MAILDNDQKPIGSKGSTTYRRRGDVIIASVKVNKRPNRPLTQAQIDWDVKWSPGTQLWKAFRDELKFGFELEKPTQTQFNMFIKYYMENPRVAFTKKESAAGAQVLDRVYVSHGSLEPEVDVLQQTDSLVVTDICLGDLVIDRDTTVAQFSLAVLQNNPMNDEGGVAPEGEARFRADDQIMYYRGVQHPATEERPPQVTISLRRVQLDVAQTTLRLWDVVGSNGFTSSALNGRQYLASVQAPYILSAYVQCRNVDKYRSLFTTQRMLGKNPLLDHYCSKAALDAAVESYGPVKPTNQFDPRTAPNAPAREAEATPGAPGSGNTGGSGNGGTQPGGGSGTGTGSDPTEGEEGSGQTPGTVDITVACADPASGTPYGGGQLTPGSEAQIGVTPNFNWNFVRWNDGDTHNPRTITVPTSNTTYTATLQLQDQQKSQQDQQQ